MKENVSLETRVRIAEVDITTLGRELTDLTRRHNILLAACDCLITRLEALELKERERSANDR